VDIIIKNVPRGTSQWETVGNPSHPSHPAAPSTMSLAFIIIPCHTITMINLKQKLISAARIGGSNDSIYCYLSWKIQAVTYTVLSSIIYDRVRMNLENEMDEMYKKDKKDGKL